MSLLTVAPDFSSTNSGGSALIVEVDVDLLPIGFFRGPKWVSLNSDRISDGLCSNLKRQNTFGKVPRHDVAVNSDEIPRYVVLVVGS